MNKPQRIEQSRLSVLSAVESLEFALATLREVGEHHGFEARLVVHCSTLRSEASRIKAVEDRERRKLLIHNSAISGGEGRA